MADKEITKHYQKEDLTIVWKPHRCIHSGICVKKLPNVYNPKARPWLTPENATVPELKEQIDACPSGALSYEQKEDKNLPDMIKITVKPNGPVLVHGDCELTLSDGTIEKKERVTALCRCGESSNKPFCDGTHNSVGFQG